jgi:hypothetical protein
LEEQKDTVQYFENLISALKNSNSIHFSAISALLGRGGTASIEKFRVLSGAPTMRKKQKNFDKLVAELTQSHLAFRKDINGTDSLQLNTALLTTDIIPETEWTDADNVLEELMSAAMANWLKNNGIGSYNKLKRNGEFNSYYWDITAPSYIYPLCTKREQIKPGFIAVDILPQYDVSEELIRYFIKKFEATRSQYNGGRFFPILLGNSFTPEAFERCKRAGFMITTPGNLFGDEIATLLSNLKNTIENMAAAASNKNEDEIAAMIRSVAKIEGKSNNIRGQLFELVVAHMVINTYPGFTEVNKKIQDTRGEKAEIDVFCQDGKKALRMYECKGYNAKQIIDLPTIKKWEEKIIAVRDWIDSTELRNRQEYFSFWTTSTFAPDALAYLDKMKSATRKFSIEYKTYQEIMQMAKNEKLNSIYDLLAEHYG